MVLLNTSKQLSRNERRGTAPLESRVTWLEGDMDASDESFKELSESLNGFKQAINNFTKALLTAAGGYFITVILREVVPLIKF